MNCGQIDRVLHTASQNSKADLSPAAQRHVAGCKRCEAVIQAFENSDPDFDFELPAAALKQITAPILETLKPVRPLPSTAAFLAIFFAIFLALTALGAYRLGSFGWQALTTFQKIVVFSSLAASAALLAFSTVRQMIPASRQPFSPALLPVGVFVLLLLAIAGVFQYENDPDFVRAGMGCLAGGIPYAIPASILFWFVLRRGAVLNPQIAGATVGMLAGLVGTSVLEVHCPILDIWHVLVWHLGVCLLGAFAGLLAGYLGSRFGRP